MKNVQNEKCYFAGDTMDFLFSEVHSLVHWKEYSEMVTYQIQYANI